MLNTTVLSLYPLVYPLISYVSYNNNFFVKFGYHLPALHVGVLNSFRLRGCITFLKYKTNAEQCPALPLRLLSLWPSEVRKGKTYRSECSLRPFKHEKNNFRLSYSCGHLKNGFTALTAITWGNPQSRMYSLYKCHSSNWNIIFSDFCMIVSRFVHEYRLILSWCICKRLIDSALLHLHWSVRGIRWWENSVADYRCVSQFQCFITQPEDMKSPSKIEISHFS